MRNFKLEARIRSILQDAGRPLTMAEISDRLRRWNDRELCRVAMGMVQRRSLKCESGPPDAEGGHELLFSPHSNWGGPKS